MVDRSTLVYKQAPWEDEQHLWLANNIRPYGEMAEFVRETEEFRQSLLNIDAALKSQWDGWLDGVDLHGGFSEWLQSVGGAYIGNFDAQAVLEEALVEAMTERGFVITEWDGKAIIARA